MKYKNKKLWLIKDKISKKKIEDSLVKINKFYKEKFINYIGKTSDTKEYYSEIIAYELLKKTQCFEKIVPITRETNGKSYLTTSHYDENFYINEESNRHEEKFAKKLFVKKKTYNSIGKIIDFQVPLKDKQSDEAGKVDLISFDENNLTLYLIELKYGENNETLLRTILEIYTYYKIVDKKKLKSDFISLFPISINVDNIKIKPAVMFVSTKCKSYKEFNEVENEGRVNLKKLASKMDITFFKSDDGEDFEMIKL